MFKARQYMAAGFVILAFLVTATTAQAAIQVEATRVIYPAQVKAATLDITNTASSPYMVQSWLDEGDKTTMPKGLPIIVTPPLMKLAPGDQSSLRFIYSGTGLPTDKESLLWINVQEIPPVSHEENVLQIAIRTRIKLFYRPVGIDSDLSHAAHSLKWQMKGGSLYVTNPSPLHVTFATMTPAKGKPIGKFDHDMVAPGQSMEVLHGKEATAFINSFGFDYVNDYGGYSHVDAVSLAH